MTRFAPIALVAFSLACDGGGAASEGAGGDTTSGDETAAPALGPLLSFVPDGSRVVARVDVARIRRSPLGPDIAGAIQASPAYQTWARGSGLEPMTDLDAVLVAGDALYSDRRVIVLRITGDEERAHDLVMRIAVSRGVTPAWREEEGFAVASYPDPSLVVPHVVVLTALHEVVIAPEDDLARVLSVAGDHAARRETPEALIEPGFGFGEGEVMSLRSDDPMPRYEGYPTPPQAYRFDVREDAGTGRTAVRIHGSFATEADAAAADAWLNAQARSMADQLLVRMAQLDRPLTEASITHAGTELDASTDFTTDELRRALGAIALYQASEGAMMEP